MPNVNEIHYRNELRTVFREPMEHIAAKATPMIDSGSAVFLSQAPLVVVATTSEAGTDASPPGGPPGFLQVIDDGARLVFADLSGNNRLDSYENILAHAQVGIMAMVPGAEETVRINGRASLSRDPELLKLTAIDSRNSPSLWMSTSASCTVGKRCDVRASGSRRRGLSAIRCPRAVS